MIRYASSASRWSASRTRPGSTSLATAAPTLVTYLGAALVLGIVGSLLLARWIKRQTLGMEPAEIAALAEQREAIFAGIAEGVIALDPNDRVTMVNPLASRLLSLPADPVGQPGRAGDRGPAARRPDRGQRRRAGRGGDQVRPGAGAEPDAGDSRRSQLGSVTTLRDRTQLAELESEIGAFRGTTDLLRAQTHEFANQLHTISGLIQIGDYEEVVSYVDALTEGRAAVDLTVARRVRDPSVAALLVAKSAVAAERQVALGVSPRTNLDPLEPQCSFDVATVLGNLIQNGIDAAASRRSRRPGCRGSRWRSASPAHASSSSSATPARGWTPRSPPRCSSTASRPRPPRTASAASGSP